MYDVIFFASYKGRFVTSCLVPWMKEHYRNQGPVVQSIIRLKSSLRGQLIKCFITSYTLMCLSIGTPKNNKFFICSKWKIYYFWVSLNLGRLQPHYNVLEYWDLKNINFSFPTNGKLMVLGVPVLKHFRVLNTLKFFVEKNERSLCSLTFFQQKMLAYLRY